MITKWPKTFVSPGKGRTVWEWGSLGDGGRSINPRSCWEEVGGRNIVSLVFIPEREETSLQLAIYSPLIPCQLPVLHQANLEFHMLGLSVQQLYKYIERYVTGWGISVDSAVVSFHVVVGSYGLAINGPVLRGPVALQPSAPDLRHQLQAGTSGGTGLKGVHHPWDVIGWEECQCHDLADKILCGTMLHIWNSESKVLDLTPNDLCPMEGTSL